jgi:hypothetical protein
MKLNVAISLLRSEIKGLSEIASINVSSSDMGRMRGAFERLLSVKAAARTPKLWKGLIELELRLNNADTHFTRRWVKEL